jgi:hypothetical protein
VIHAPFLGEVYHATRGGGAFLNGEPIRVSAAADPADALFATGFPFKQGKGDVELYFRLVAEVLLASHGVRRAGAAALDLAYVAAGRVDGFFEIGLSPWDVAAGMLLVQEAGGRVEGWPGDAIPRSGPAACSPPTARCTPGSTRRPRGTCRGCSSAISYQLSAISYQLSVSGSSGFRAFGAAASRSRCPAVAEARVGRKLAPRTELIADS